MSSPRMAKKRRWIWYVLIPILAAVLVWMGDAAYHSVRLYQDARQAQGLVEKGFSKQTLAEGIPLLQDAYREFSSLDQDLRPLVPLLDWVGRLPGPGKYAGQAGPLLDYARSGLLAADLTSRGLSPILDQLSQTGQPTSTLERIVAELARARAKFEAASSALDEAAAARKRIQLDLLPAKVQDAIRKLDAKMDLARGSLVLLSVLPQLAGTDQEQTYLLAAQNSDELRPSGGFISALGLLKVKSGQVTAFSMQDSFAVDDFSKDYPYPPDPLQRFMLSEYWLPRDANWYADFPSSAGKLQELYELSTGQKTSGVIAFDQRAVAGMLQELGPQQIPGMSEPLSGSNAIEWMRQAWSPQPGKGVDPGWWAQRKSFIGAVGKAILTQISGIQDEQKAAHFLSAGYGMLNQGHLLVYLNQSKAQEGLAQAGLDGSVRPPSPGTDFLMLVDTNIGFNKVDALIARSWEYQLDLSDPARASARLIVRYTHLAQQPVLCKQEAVYGENYADLEQRCYWDYWRVLTIPGKQLENYKTFPVPASWLLNHQDWDGHVASQTSETGLNEFAGLFVLETASKKSFELDWSLPAGLVQPTLTGWSYRLRLQKQPGLSAFPVSVQVLPPAGCPALNPAGWTTQAGQLVWKQNLEESVILELDFKCR